MKKALFFSIAINCIVCVIVIYFIGKRYYYSRGAGAGTEVAYYDQWNSMRRSLYSIMSIDSTDVVFIGNSHTECFPVTEFFGNHVKNRGIGGNQTEHILQRLGDIVNKHPKKIFIEAGVNDITVAGNADKAFANYKQIIATIKQASPTTSIYVQSVFPVCHRYEKDNKSIVALNSRLAELCSYNGVEYVDIYPRMVTAGKLDSSLTYDGLHLNGKGYKVWKEVIEKYVR